MPPKRGGRRQRYVTKRSKQGRIYQQFAGKKKRFIPRKRGGLRKRLGRRIVRGGKGRRRNRRNTRSSVTPNAIRKALTKIQGAVVRYAEGCQNHWQVPVSTDDGLGFVEPRATYMWNKILGTDLTVPMYYPLRPILILQLLQKFYPSFGAITNNSFSWIYNTMIHVKWTAKYIVKNTCNMPVKYQAIKFTSKDDIIDPEAAANKYYSYNNLMNIAGAESVRTGKGVTDDATNLSLTWERTKIETYKTIKVFFKTQKKAFTLQPGKAKTFTLSGSKWLNTLKLYTGLWINLTALEPRQTWQKGVSHLMFKMYSDLSDYKEAVVTNPLEQASTRTTPSSMLSYQCDYVATKPTEIGPNESYGYQNTAGVVLVPDVTKIQNIVDLDIGMGPQILA